MATRALIMTEKPSQGRAWADALGGMSGTYKGVPYTVVSAAGHLYGFKDPSEMVPPDRRERVRSWDLSNLPWDPAGFDWSEEVIEGKDDLVERIVDAARGCGELVVAGDVDRSGEGFLIQAEIILNNGLEKGRRVSRAYFEDQSPAELRRAFEQRKAVPDIWADREFRSALFRTRWDLCSMQFTRIASSFAPYRVVVRQGRLKSSAVMLIGSQQDAYDAYVKKTVYQASFVDERGVRYVDAEQPTYDARGDVPLGGLHACPVVEDSCERRHTAPPSMMDLATLQARLAPKGLKPAAFLKITEDAYTAGYLSYPRSDEHTVTQAMWDEMMPILDDMCRVVGVDPASVTHRTARRKYLGSGLAHGANRPGKNVPPSLDWMDSRFGAGAGLVYETLARNFIACCCDDYEFDHHVGHPSDYPSYVGSADVTAAKGWRLVFDDDPDADAGTETGGLGTTAAPDVREITNRRPPAPTTKWLYEQWRRRDIGTGATRVSCVEEISKADTRKGGTRQLVRESRGKLSLTDTGKLSYQLLPNTHIGSLEMTKHVQDEMVAASDGADIDRMLAEVAGFVTDDIETMRENAAKVGANARERVQGTFGGKTVSFSRTFSGHRFTDDEVARLLAGETIRIEATYRDGSHHTVWGALGTDTFKGNETFGFRPDFNHDVPEEYCGHRFTDEEAQALRDGRCILIKGLRSKSKKARNKKFDAGVSWSRADGIRLHF